MLLCAFLKLLALAVFGLVCLAYFVTAGTHACGLMLCPNLISFSNRCIDQSGADFANWVIFGSESDGAFLTPKTRTDRSAQHKSCIQTWDGKVFRAKYNLFTCSVGQCYLTRENHTWYGPKPFDDSATAWVVDPFNPCKIDKLVECVP